MFGFRHGLISVRQLSAGMRLMLTGIFLLLLANPVSANWVGMLSDNGGDRISVFDADTDSVQTNFAAAPGFATGDCAVSSDQTFGITTNSSSLISFIELAADSANSADHGSQVEISNLGVDMALSPDNAFLVTAGGGALDQPLSVISMEDRSEVSTSKLFTDHTSVEFCDDGTLLVTTSNGAYYGSDSGSSLYDASINESGEIDTLGNRLASDALPNNSACAPGSKAGVLVDRDGGLTSFTLPGLKPATYVKTQSAEVVSASFSSDGTRLYVRTANSVEAYDFNPVTGEMTSDWQRPAPLSSPYFGMDQIAVHPTEDKLYVDGGDVLLILNTANGDKKGSIEAGDATGVCFANAPLPSVEKIASEVAATMPVAPPP